MDEFIKELDQNLDYIKHESNTDEIIIYVTSNRKTCDCPYCGSPSKRVHSHYRKSFQDLPIMGKKTKIVIENRKIFCDNPDCSFTTFAERFEDKIVDVSLNTSSLVASRILNDGIADIGKSSICNLLKKRYANS